MNIVISPTNKSNTDFNLSLSSKYFELELQDWHFAYCENAEDLLLRFEPDDSPSIITVVEEIQSGMDSQNSFVEFSRHQDFVLALQ